MPNQLILGSGQWHWDGWVMLDANCDNHPDILAVVPPLPVTVMAVPWDTILASHVIEHVSLLDAKVLIKQCYGCLAPGGKLILDQPDIDYCMTVALGITLPPPGRDVVQFGLQGIYGAQNGNSWDGHKWGYTPHSLTELLVEAGFDPANIGVGPGRYHEPIRDFMIEAIK